MRKKKDGDTLGEQIEKQLAKVSKKNVCLLIDDAFYKVEVEKSLQLQVRRTNYYRYENLLKLNYSRTYDLPDEALIR